MQTEKNCHRFRVFEMPNNLRNTFWILISSQIQKLAPISTAESSLQAIFVEGKTV